MRGPRYDDVRRERRHHRDRLVDRLERRDGEMQLRQDGFGDFAVVRVFVDDEDHRRVAVDVAAAAAAARLPAPIASTSLLGTIRHVGCQTDTAAGKAQACGLRARSAPAAGRYQTATGMRTGSAS